MKKYKRLTKELTYDSYLIETLEKEAQRGWSLKSMNHFFLTFEKTVPQTWKYQIDDNELTPEYMSVLKELGYHFCCSYEKRNIYKNSHIDATPLQTDEKAQLIAMKSHYTFQKIAYYLFWTLVFLFESYHSIYYLKQFGYPHSLSLLLTHTFVYLLTILFSCWSFVSFLEVIYCMIMNRYLTRQITDGFYHINMTMESFIKSHKYLTLMNDFLLVSILYTFVAYVLPISSITALSIYFICLIFFIVYHIVIPLKHNTIIIGITAFSLIVIALFINQTQSFKLSSIDSLYSQNQVNNNFISDSKGFLANTKQISLYSHHYERFVVCFNPTIAKIIFQQDIIIADREYRKATLIADHQAKGEDYNNNDYPYTSYESSIKNMKKYETNKADECYFNDMYVVCYHDNKVLSFQIQGDISKIDTLLNYYF